jgi:prevent-host-death family protein
MDRIGVRELRQHASRYLARVAGGETIEVTDRGRPVARLVPVDVDSWAAMVAAGRIVEASASADVTLEAPADYGIVASAELERAREAER